MKIYTKSGDDGSTGLYGGDRVGKDDPRVRAYGTVDECNAVIGVAMVDLDDSEIAEILSRVQGELMVVGADLATPREKGDVVPRVTSSMTAALEAEIDRFHAELAPLRNFIKPGGSRAGASIHHARAICRRAERQLVELMREQNVNPEALIYLNRLSDHLFTLARLVNRRSGSPEAVWRRE